ncbi:MAG: TolC family protein [Gammaproteobacteria bacterium]|nr:TolC family protein [Gammaproteobacteria bacterium]
MRSRHCVVVLALFATACTVGPRYDEPETPMPARFDQAPPEAAAEPAGDGLWAGFGSAELDALIARALEANTTIAQANARLAENRAISGASIYYWFPTVTTVADRQRSQFSSDEPFAPPGRFTSDVYRAGFDATWEIDLFGSLRNEFRAQDSRTVAEAAALADAQLTIVAETAQAWFAMIGARERLALQRRQHANLEENVRILDARVRAGSSNALDLAQAEAEMRSVAASVTQAEADLVREEQRLAVLTAWPVGTLREHLAPQAQLPPLPALVATGTPEEWLKRRPDVRAAERLLAASYADIGDEIAEYFPKVTLLGRFGWTAEDRSAIGEREAERWFYGPSITWSILDAGRTRQRVKAAEARRDGAIAAYQETVLTALEETENALAGFRAANQSEHELKLGAAAAREAARLARLRYDTGASDYLAVLVAERQQINLEDQHLQSGTRRATSLAALYKALAGAP